MYAMCVCVCVCLSVCMTDEFQRYVRERERLEECVYMMMREFSVCVYDAANECQRMSLS